MLQHLDYMTINIIGLPLVESEGPIHPGLNLKTHDSYIPEAPLKPFHSHGPDNTYIIGISTSPP
mgnify:CR=1 FL=1